VNKPSVGRIVHYVDLNHEHCAAIVTGLGADDGVFLTVFPMRGNPYPAMNVASHDEEQKVIGSWHWPERVE